MPTIRIPNRSTIALQKNEETGEFGWRNSQPGLFSYDDTNGYRYDTNNIYTMRKFGPSLKLFCKDTVTGEKLWMNSPTGYMTSDYSDIANVKAIRFIYKKKNDSKDYDTGWMNTFITDWNDHNVYHNMLCLSRTWHMIRFNNIIFPSTCYEVYSDSDYKNMPRSLIESVSVFEMRLSPIQGESAQLAKCLAQGLSYNEMGPSPVRNCVGDGYVEVTYEDNSDEFVYHISSIGDSAQKQMKSWVNGFVLDYGDISGSVWEILNFNSIIDYDVYFYL